VWFDLAGRRNFREGGGVLCELSSPTIRFNRIVGNRATDVGTNVRSAGGGGIRCGYAEPRILNNVIENNAGRYGGGITLFHSAAEVRNNLIIGNEGGEDFGGAGLWIVEQLSRRLTTIVEYNTIIRNRSLGDDGGDARVMRGKAGAVLTGRVRVSIEHNVIAENTQASGGEIGVAPGAPAVVRANVFTGTGPVLPGNRTAALTFVSDGSFDILQRRGATPVGAGAYAGKGAARLPVASSGGR
jgi:hypothetical protein